MTYDQQILDLLLAVGERGISVSALTKHVFNLNSTFFSQPDLQEVKQYVQQYLLRNSKSKHSLIESTGRRGFYRLNTQNSVNARQLMLNFQDEKQPGAAERQQSPGTTDLSLDLF